jgi:hypothetical protein
VVSEHRGSARRGGGGRCIDALSSWHEADSVEVEPAPELHSQGWIQRRRAVEDHDGVGRTIEEGDREIVVVMPRVRRALIAVLVTPSSSATSLTRRVAIRTQCRPSGSR